MGELYLQRYITHDISLDLIALILASIINNITYNKKGNVVVYIGADEVSEDGAIQLSDRYGDAGWGKTGKR